MENVTAWDVWAVNDPTGAGIDLAREALADLASEYPDEDDARLAARALAEGVNTWTSSPGASQVWPEIVREAEAYLTARARR